MLNIFNYNKRQASNHHNITISNTRRKSTKYNSICIQEVYLYRTVLLCICIHSVIELVTYTNAITGRITYYDIDLYMFFITPTYVIYSNLITTRLFLDTNSTGPVFKLFVMVIKLYIYIYIYIYIYLYIFIYTYLLM